MFRFLEGPPVVNGLSFNAAITFVAETTGEDPHNVAIQGHANPQWLRDTVRGCQQDPARMRALATDGNVADEPPDLNAAILAARGAIQPVVQAPAAFSHPVVTAAAVMASYARTSRQAASGIETADEAPDLNAAVRAARGIQ